MIIFFTVLSVIITSICVARPLNLLLLAKMNCDVINWYEECSNLIDNLVAYMINLGLQNVFFLNRDTPISVFIQQVQSLKKLESINFSEYKPCWIDDILIAALVGPAILFSALLPSFLGFSLLSIIFISTSLFLRVQLEIRIAKDGRRISYLVIILQVFILLYFLIFIRNSFVFAYNFTIYLSYLFIINRSFCIFTHKV